MAQTLLKVDNINVFYGNIHAVKDVSFEVNEGEIVTLIGANGAGKSTTLKTISGLLHPKTGDVLYKGNMINAGVTSPFTLYDEQTASFGVDKDYDQSDATGFINLFGLSIKERAKLSKNWPEIK